MQTVFAVVREGCERAMSALGDRDSVLLVHPLGAYGRSALVAAGFVIPPLGPMYLAAQLKRHGQPVRFVNEEIEGPVLEEVLARPAAEAPLLLGIYVNHSSQDRVRQAIASARPRTATRIVVGGPATQAPESFLEAGADAACLGEGEETILGLSAWARGDTQLADVAGIAYRVDGRLMRTAARAFQPDLDSLPFPDWDFYPPDRVHYDNLYPPALHPFATLITSRGCPMRCRYCSSPELWSHLVRRRSVGSVMEEIDRLRARFGVRFLDIYDDIFNLAPRWTVEFCEALLQRGAPVRWGAYFYPAGFDAELLRLARRAGLSLFKIGVQSGSAQILRNIERRPETLEEARRFLAEASSLRIFSSIDFIFGLPGETADTLAESIRYIRGLKADAVKIGKLVVLPGSPIDRQGLGHPVLVSDREIDRAIRRALLGYYLRPAGLARTARWGLVRALRGARLQSLVGLARVAFAGRSFPKSGGPPRVAP